MAPQQTASLIQEQPDGLRLDETEFSRLDGFETDRIKQAEPALKKSCAVLENDMRAGGNSAKN